MTIFLTTLCVLKPNLILIPSNAKPYAHYLIVILLTLPNPSPYYMVIISYPKWLPLVCCQFKISLITLILESYDGYALEKLS